MSLCLQQMKYGSIFKMVGVQKALLLSVEKQLALTLYFLNDQGSLSMTANAFGVACCTVSVTVRKVCEFGTRVHQAALY